MIAFIRASFPGTPAKAVWSDTVAHNWMDPTIPFSLAHFWKLSTFHQVDLQYHLFPPVVLDDPRPGASDPRDQLVRAVLDEVDRSSHPNWNLFDRCIINFAQTTDLFGGGAHRAPNGKLILAAVFDVNSRFDEACQEVGHTFNLQHELGGSWYYSWGSLTNEYECPYSVMSAATMDLTWTRKIDPRLPGAARPELPQNVVGPYVPAVHLYINQYGAVNPSGAFNNVYSVNYVPATYEHTQVSLELVARDVAIAAWPNRRPVLAVVPPIVPGGDTHFLELRRKDAFYDAGIGNASITILAASFFSGSGAVADPATIRIRYVDRIDLEGVEGDLDYHSFAGRFVVRVNSYDDDFAAVNLTVGGGDAWKNFSVSLADPAVDRALRDSSDWRPATVAPCPIYPKGDYSYRYKRYSTFFVLRAHSIGYERPAYAWYLENVWLDPAGSGVEIEVPCRDVDGHELGPPVVRRVGCQYQINGGRLELAFAANEFADINIGVRVVVGESSPEVMKNFYPERSIFTTIRVDNLEIEWDDRYQEAQLRCWKKFLDIERQFSKSLPPIPPIPPIPEPDPRLDDRTIALLQWLIQSNPVAATAAIDAVAQVANISRAQELRQTIASTPPRPATITTTAESH
ncbi:hypothetical protein [Mycobacterium sp. OTB74]|jgi:hypothetical protein|uniref:hypothetical protein n=1 Tax=Mycobacterium sp. OTB74 TaxID=1853452 RepID=UPI0024730BDB|nr:hypothetical protein [Mycobacterium sp. OTB74]MDH6244424.1 hypothetical protein [Mycobacterium sp. OTB74]